MGLAQGLEVGVRVEPGVPGRPLRSHEPLVLVDPQRLRVHADDLGGDGDHVAGRVVHQATIPSRGFSRETFCRFSIASRSAFVTFLGTASFTRARRSPLPAPFSFGAPRPRTRSIVPSCVPGLTFSVTGPASGVGTETLAPSAASGYVTGRSTTRSASPRRLNVGDSATRVTT